MSGVKCPVTVFILAMLHIVIGVLYLLASPIAIMLFLAGPPTHMGVAASKYQTAAYQGVSFCFAAITFHIAVLLIATGIGLIRLRPWAWTSSVVLAIASGFSFILSRIGFLVVASSSTSGEPYWLALIVGSVVLFFPQVIHPLLTFAVLLPKSNRDAYRAPVLLDLGKLDPQKPPVSHKEWYCRIGKQVLGPATRQQMDEAVMEGRITNRTEIWQRGQPSIWAEEVYPNLQSSLAQPLRWLVHGPSIAPYRPSSKRTGEGWKWAIVVASVLYALLQLISIILTTEFTIESMPFLVMGFGAIVAGVFALAASLFEWRWFFNGRQARGLRQFVGDPGARWFYLAISVFVLLLGFGMAGVYGIRSQVKSRPPALSSPPTRQPGTIHNGKFNGERTAQCGGVGGGGFERFDPDHRPVLGFRYELGAFGVVYRAYDPLLDREVALKVPHHGALTDEQDRARYLREPKAAAQLRHPNIVPVFDAMLEGDNLYVASALIEGESLQAMLTKNRPSCRDAASLVFRLADALAYAHGKGIVHRDVKPANIMHAAFSPDGRKIVSADHVRVRFWDVETGAEIVSLEAGVTKYGCIAFSPDGRQMAIADRLKIRLCDAETGETRRELSGHVGYVKSLAYSHDGQRLVTAGMDKTLRFWDPVRGTLLLTLNAHAQAIDSVAISVDGSLIASAAIDGSVVLWNGRPLD